MTGRPPLSAPTTGTVGGAWATTAVVAGAPLGPLGAVITTEATVTTVGGTVGDTVGAGRVAVGAVVTGTVTPGALVAGAVVVGPAHTGMVLVPVSKLQPMAPVGSSNADTLTRQLCVTVGSPNAKDTLVDAPKAVVARSVPSIHTRTVLTPSAL